jgi:N-acetylmuramoyl-L-alanine amidase
MSVLALAAALAAATVSFLGTTESRPPPVVVLDPGHNARANLGTEPIGPGASRRKVKDGGGATGVVSGTPEAVVTLDVSLRLRLLLRRAGVRVLMTRTRTRGVNRGNIALAGVANRARADLFLRVHADSATDPSVRGTHTLYPARRRGWTDDIYATSRRAARLVQRALVQRLGFPDRGLDERGDITGFNWSDRPAILVELGFLSNPTEDRLLNTPAYRRRAARGLCEGTLRFVGLVSRLAECRTA